MLKRSKNRHSSIFNFVVRDLQPTYQIDVAEVCVGLLGSHCIDDSPWSKMVRVTVTGVSSKEPEDQSSKSTWNLVIKQYERGDVAEDPRVGWDGHLWKGSSVGKLHVIQLDGDLRGDECGAHLVNRAEQQQQEGRQLLQQGQVQPPKSECEYVERKEAEILTYTDKCWQVLKNAENTGNAPQVGLIVPYSLFREKQYRDKISVSVKVSIKKHWFRKTPSELIQASFIGVPQPIREITKIARHVIDVWHQ